MRKLVLVVLIIMGAAATYASTFKWAASGLQNGKSATMTSGTAYLFDARTTTQSSLYEAIKSSGASALTASSIANNTVSDGSLALTAFEHGTTGQSYDFYFAIFDASSKQVYFSQIKEDFAAKPTPQFTAVGFGVQDGSATFASETGFQGAGAWSSTESVPEPFSGALALVGLGVIGLRRKLKGKKQEKKA